VNINFSLGNIGNLNRLSEDYMRRNATVTPAPVAPRPAPVAAPVAPTPAPVEYSSFDNPFLEYRDTLSGGANYASINDVDNVDDFYDNSFQKAFADTGYLLDTDIIGGEGGIGGGQVDYSPTRILSEQEYRGFVGDAPAYLSDFGKIPSDISKAQQAFSSVQNLKSTEELQDALSSYYGYDVTASKQSFSKADFGGNLGKHTNSSDSQLQQFHSLVEPILKDQVSYLQATKGLSYQDALMESYSNDPMLQALYHKYDVKPVRQTDDGSTYLYDPFSFSEIRTFESKDPTLLSTALDIGKAVALTYILGPKAGLTAYGNVLGSAAAAVGTTATNMAVAASVSAILGGNPLEAALMAGLPIGQVPIPKSNGATLGSAITNTANTLLGESGLLNASNFNLMLGTPMGTAMSSIQVLGSVGASGGIGSTGVGPDFNPYINNIAASVAGTTVEAEEEQYNIDLANLAALSQPEEAPVTPVAQPEFDNIAADTTVEPIEQPELPLDIAPPPFQDSETGSATSSPTSVESGSSGEIEGDVVDPNTNIIYRQLIEAANQEEDGSALKDALLAEAERYRMEPEIYESDALLGPSSRPWDVDPENWVDNVVTFLYSDLSSSTPPSIGGESLDITGGTDSEVSTDGTTTGDDALDGDGSGNGAGGDAGSGVRQGLGMLAAAAGGKPSVTDLVFSDYVKRYEAPELQERALPLQGYQAPQGLFRGLV